MPSSHNQGDAWTVTSAYLDRFVDEQRLLAASERAGESEEQIAYLRYMSQTGRRVAEMHIALASHDELADFAPEPIHGRDVQRWIDEICCPRRTRLRHAEATARCAEGSRSAADRSAAGAAAEPAGSPAARCCRDEIDGLNIRHHGDFHLGQMLIVKDDIFIIDFEGEPRRTLAERRRKAPAARDVAGLIRSIDYSATAALERALKVAPTSRASLPRRSPNGATGRRRRSWPPIARPWPISAAVAGRPCGRRAAC